MQYSIGVVIPTHNRPDTLNRALVSISRQTVLPHEVIVVDDGSVVPTELDDLPVLPGVETSIIRNQVSLGANASRNLGVRVAKSDFMCFLDDDDEFLPEKIARIGEVIAQGGADIIFHPALMTYDREGISYVSKPSASITFSKMLVSNILGGTSMVCVDRRRFLDAGGFDEALPALQDYEAWLRCAKLDYRFRRIDQPLTRYHHVTTKSSISKSLVKMDAALAIIDAKYADDIDALDSSQRRDRQKNDVSRRVRRMLNRGENISAAVISMRNGLRYRDLPMVLVGFAALFGLKATLKLGLLFRSRS